MKQTKNFHDRFIIIDNKEVYHIGASLKDLGHKVFAFSKIEIVQKKKMGRIFLLLDIHKKLQVQLC